jgi:hypothetical protein
VKDALAEVKQGQNEENAFASLTAMMRSTKVSTNDFICAKKMIEGYTSPKTHLAGTTASQENSIRTAAKFALMVYDQHIDINHRMLDLLKKLSPTSNVAEISDQISTLQVERGQRWADLVTPSGLALMLLVDQRPTDDKGNFIKTSDPSVGSTKRLIISKQQKKELLDWLNDHFTELGDGTPQDQWSDATKTAQLYVKLFDGRKCSDE